MKKFDTTLKECQIVLDKIENNTFDLDYQKTFVNQKIKEIDEKIKQLENLKETLKEHLNAYCSHEELKDSINTQ